MGITPQGLYYMSAHDLPGLYNRNAGGRAFGILPDGQKVVVLFKLLRSLRKYGHPMAAYAEKIIAF